MISTFIPLFNMDVLAYLSPNSDAALADLF